MRPRLPTACTTWLAAVLVAWPGGAGAAPGDGTTDDPPRTDAAAPHALGRVLTAGPAAAGLTLLSSGGYGYTGSVLGMNDAHHRLAGALAIDERLLPWLDLGVRFDGRYDAHVAPGQPTDSGLVGDPRFYARVDRRWGGGLRLGARAGLWLSGRNAPSLDGGAVSPELLGLASYASPSLPVTISANVGYRVDRSAHSAPDAAKLSAGDRLALEVSAFDEVLAGVAGTIGRGPLQGFLEASMDLLVGRGAPSAGASPMFVGGGGRLAVGRNLLLEAELELSPSRRPETAVTAPLVPVPPRFGTWLGLAYTFGAAPAPPPPPPPAPPPPPPSTPPQSTSTPAPAPVVNEVTLSGHVSAADGSKLAELRVEVVVDGAPRDVGADEDGRFTITAGAGQDVTVTAEAAGHLPGRATVTLRDGVANTTELTLQRPPPQGQLRGLVRSLRGTAVDAEVTVQPELAGAEDSGDANATTLRAPGGRFQLDVAPGRYRVTISATGYEIQRRKVDVEENGVTLLNVDLRSER